MTRRIRPATVSSTCNAAADAGAVRRWRTTGRVIRVPSAGSSCRLPRRSDFVVHVVTDENLPRYRSEHLSLERLCATAAPPGSASRLVIPTLLRDRSLWLSGDVLLVAIGRTDGTVAGAVRLSSMLGPPERYVPLAHYGKVPVQRSPSVYLWDGLHVAVGRREADRLPDIQAVLLAGLQSFALKSDIEQLGAVVNLAWLPHLLELGWNPLPLDLPSESRSIAAVPVHLDISEYALKRTRSVLSVAGPRLVRRGIARPWTSTGNAPRLMC